MKRIRICNESEIPGPGMKCYDTEGGVKVLVANSGEAFHAYQGLCPHQDVCLDEGFFDGSTLTCHQHLWQWDIQTGAALGLAEAPLERFEIERIGGEIFVLQSSALRACELFREVSAETVSRLDEVSRREEHSAGTALYDIGDPADDLYILESGRVEFEIGRDDRTRMAGFMLRKGEMFGWAALLQDHPRRIARATCIEPSTLLRLRGETVLSMLSQQTADGFIVMRQLSTLITRHLRTQGGK